MKLNNKKLQQAQAMLTGLYTTRSLGLLTYISSEMHDILGGISHQDLEKHKLNIPTRKEDIGRYSSLDTLEKNILNLGYTEHEYDEENIYEEDNKKDYKTLLEKDLDLLVEGNILTKKENKKAGIYYDINMDTCKKIERALVNFG